MTKIYLDANDCVCVDKTPNAEHANRAFLDRGLLELYGRLRRLGERTAMQLEAEGRCSTSARSGLEQIDLVCANIKADAS